MNCNEFMAETTLLISVIWYHDALARLILVNQHMIERLFEHPPFDKQLRKLEKPAGQRLTVHPSGRRCASWVSRRGMRKL